MLLKNNKSTFFYNTLYYYIANNYISESHESSTFESFKAYFYSSNNLFTKKLRKQGMSLSIQLIVVLEFLLIYTFIYFSISELYNLYSIYLFNNYCTISILSFYIFNAYYFNKFIDNKIKNKFITYLIARFIFLIIISFIYDINLILSISITLLFIIFATCFSKFITIFISNVRLILFGKSIPKYKLTKLKYWSTLISILVFLIYFDFITFKSTIEIVNFSTILFIFKDISHLNINFKNLLLCNPEDTIITRNPIKYQITTINNPLFTKVSPRYLGYNQAQRLLQYDNFYNNYPTSDVFLEESIQGRILRVFTKGDITIEPSMIQKQINKAIRTITVLPQNENICFPLDKWRDWLYKNTSVASKQNVSYEAFIYPGTYESLVSLFKSLYGHDNLKYLYIDPEYTDNGIKFTILNKQLNGQFNKELLSYRSRHINDFLLYKKSESQLINDFYNRWINELKDDQFLVLRTKIITKGLFINNTYRDHIKNLTSTISLFAYDYIFNVSRRDICIGTKIYTDAKGNAAHIEEIIARPRSTLKQIFTYYRHPLLLAAGSGAAKHIWDMQISYRELVPMIIEREKYTPWSSSDFVLKQANNCSSIT